MENIQGHFCPVCKRSNKPDAVLCAYCGAALDVLPASPPTTEKIGGPSVVFPKEPPRLSADTMVPEGGIAIFIVDNPKPIAILDADEFILGRIMEGSPETVIDLTPFGAFGSGVSRRHAMVRRSAKGYEVIDLDSTNGTWLNEKRMTPTKAYPLPNGATVRLGQLRLQVVVREA
jgi:hypothetical protein